MIRDLLLGLASFLGIVALVLGVVTYWVFAPSGRGCEQHQVFAEAVFLDGSWVARFYQNVCGEFGTYVDDTVEIARPNEAAPHVPTVGVVVFEMMDQPGPMALRWLNARELEVTIPNDVWAGGQQSSFADLTISYRYIPDDPVERACLKQWRSVPIEEMVRRSSSATENGKAFLARCVAESVPH